MAKIRLDALLVQRGLCSGRDRAKGYIMAGQVYVDGQKADKPGLEVAEDCGLELRGNPNPFVSRGGLKLQKAMEVFPVALQDAVCMDIGASTGGFTDCMLQSGARKVYAVDVGYGQLAWKLRQDSRVVVMERTNIRHVTLEQIGEMLDFSSVDVSFISLKLVLPVVQHLLRPEGQVVCLVKPQFEAGREKVGKKGVVRDAETHQDVLYDLLGACAQLQLCALGLEYSPVRGPEGNIEYLLYLKKTPAAAAVDEAAVRSIVALSHQKL